MLFAHHLALLTTIVAVLNSPAQSYAAQNYTRGAGVAQQNVPSERIQNYRLEVGESVERELTGKEAHVYTLTLSTNQYLRVRVDQRGIDVVVVLFSPDGKQLVVVDSEEGKQGPELFSIISAADGKYHLLVQPLDKDAGIGRYEAKIEELRVATMADRNRTEAESLMRGAMHLYAQDTVEFKRGAIEKLEQAILLWQKVGEKAKEAEALSYIAQAYRDLSEMQKSLSYLNRALPLAQLSGDRATEFRTLMLISMAYLYSGETQKSLDYMMRAVELAEAMKDPDKQDIAYMGLGRLYADMGEWQKALDYYDESLKVIQAARSVAGDTPTLYNVQWHCCMNSRG
jgi:hypothetical protein